MPLENNDGVYTDDLDTDFRDTQKEVLQEMMSGLSSNLQNDEVFQAIFWKSFGDEFESDKWLNKYMANYLANNTYNQIRRQTSSLEIIEENASSTTSVNDPNASNASETDAIFTEPPECDGVK